MTPDFKLTAPLFFRLNKEGQIDRVTSVVASVNFDEPGWCKVTYFEQVTPLSPLGPFICKEQAYPSGFPPVKINPFQEVTAVEVPDLPLQEPVLPVENQLRDIREWLAAQTGFMQSQCSTLSEMRDLLYRQVWGAERKP